ncbi:hypothetical protein N7478_011985 [Penicillium angulare]|uniref:uncharacterized protein n=1 Tax=Penicillium angulare TaxID=116970 RepID=UPI002541795A|nr:uncharacterized protein N7478_011985 [Penicillium angulare]KAJ5261390.1 hypothetical protein N7478_011985 [Penicillium angulare]
MQSNVQGTQGEVRLSLLGRAELSESTTYDQCSPSPIGTHFGSDVSTSTPEECEIHSTHATSPLDTESHAVLQNAGLSYPVLNDTPFDSANSEKSHIYGNNQGKFDISPADPGFSPHEVNTPAPIVWDRDPSLQLTTLEAECMEFDVEEIGPWE